MRWMLMLGCVLCWGSVSYAQAQASDANDVGLVSLADALSSVARPTSDDLVVRALDIAQKYPGFSGIAGHQVWLLVDRNPSVQRLWVMARMPSGEDDVVTAIPVSTGKPGRREHYKTALGVFHYDGHIMGYRALGTKNENGIRGIGVRGERVWDFGWQTTEDWRHPGDIADIRMAMHATDPTYLAPRLGHWDSEGCIRLPAKAESVFDRYGVLDADILEQVKQGDRGWGAMLSKRVDALGDWRGNSLVVVDSSNPQARLSDPDLAASREAGQ